MTNTWEEILADELNELKYIWVPSTAFGEDSELSPTLLRIVEKIRTDALAEGLAKKGEYGRKMYQGGVAEERERYIKVAEEMKKEEDWRKIERFSGSDKVSVANNNSIYNQALSDLIEEAAEALNEQLFREKDSNELIEKYLSRKNGYDTGIKTAQSTIRSLKK